MIVKWRNALCKNGRCTGRPMEDLPNGHNVALHRLCRPVRTDGSMSAGCHCGPRGAHHSRTTRRGRTTLWSPMGRATAPSLPRSSGCAAHRAVLFSPPRDGFSILDDLWKLMKPPRSKLRGITRKGIVCETPRFLTLFPLQGNLGASSEESPD